MTQSPARRRERIAAAQRKLEEYRDGLLRLGATLAALADETADQEELGRIRAINGKVFQALGILNTAGKLPSLPPIPPPEEPGGL